MGLILVVSEDLAELETVRAALSVHGWWVTVAADRRTALQSAADQAPKLVVVDNDLADAAELLGSFGSVNGGPGAVVLIGEGFEGTLELKEAGADELLTKPASPARVLEAVQRCLAAPRPGPPSPRVSSNRLLTTEEIFGDVLREIGERDAPRTLPAAAAEPAPETPPAPLLSTPDDLFAPAGGADRTVSLAGLFDDPPEAPAAQESAGAHWRGEERRAADRPWSSAGADDDGETVVPSMPTVSSPAPPAVARPDESEALEALEAPEAEVLEAPVEPEEAAPTEDLEAAAPPPDDEAPAARRVPRAAVAIGSLAAALLVAAGALIFLDAGSEPPPAPLPPAPVETTDVAPPPGSPALEPEAAGPPAGDVPEPAPAEPEPQPAPPSGEAEEFDIEAIVDEELQRREEVLRRVFLEEEKRLLRELNNLDSGESPGGDGSGGDG